MAKTAVPGWKFDGYKFLIEDSVTSAAIAAVITAVHLNNDINRWAMLVGQPWLASQHYNNNAAAVSVDW